ncbi:MAG TPA: hypothetical protein VMG34_15980 [Bacteroidota bacterium]|nr:hypothetical protein [Bacteroidota bacterium]
MQNSLIRDDRIEEPGWVLLSAVIGGTLVVHTPNQFVVRWLDALSASYGVRFLTAPETLFAVSAARGIIFFASILVLGFLFLRPVVGYIAERRGLLFPRKVLVGAAAVFFTAGILVFPTHLGIMGVGYGEMSKDPFGFQDATNQIYQRLLLPALAYFLQFRGPLLFHIFSLVLTFLLLLAVILYLRTRGIETGFVETLGIAVSTFVITQFQSPGYTEQLALIILLVMESVPLGLGPKIAAAALALFAHEVSILPLIAITLLEFSRKEKAWLGIIVFLYALSWLASYRFDLMSLMSVRAVGGLPGTTWLFNHPLRELGGILVSYKLLWILIPFALFTRRYARETLFLLLPGLVATCFGVDTSRLMAFSLFAFLIAIVVVKKDQLIPERVLRLLFALNVCLPSVYIGLNSGLVYFDGLYRLFYRGIFFQ